MGLTDIVVVAMRDAVLVAHKDKDQDVKIVSKLKRENVKQAEIFLKTIVLGVGLKVLRYQFFSSKTYLC